MERTKKTIEVNQSREKDPHEGMVQYIKIGGGTHRYYDRNGRRHILKRGERFWARPEEISDNFKDVIKPVDQKVEAEVTKPLLSASKFEVVNVSPGWFNVVNLATSKPVNDKPMREEEAKKLLQVL